MRVNEKGASRNNDDGKFGMSEFLHPLVEICFGAYMHFHRMQDDGTLRSPGNWQKGLDSEWLVDSGIRHTFDKWLFHKGCTGREDMMKALLGEKFNTNAYILEEALKRGYDKMSPDEIYQDMFRVELLGMGKKHIDGHGGVV